MLQPTIICFGTVSKVSKKSLGKTFQKVFTSAKNKYLELHMRSLEKQCKSQENSTCLKWQGERIR